MTPFRDQPSRLCKSKQQAREPTPSNATAKSSVNNSPGRQTRAPRNHNKQATTKMTEKGCHHLEDAVQSTGFVATSSTSSSNSHVHPQTTADARAPTQEQNKRIIPNPTVPSESKRRKPLSVTESPESSLLPRERVDADGKAQTDRTQEFALEPGNATDPEPQSDSDNSKGQPSIPSGVKDMESEAKQKAFAGDNGPSLQMTEPSSKKDNEEREEENTTLVPLHKSLKMFPRICSDAFYSNFPLNVPEGHKFVHVMRHCCSWKNLSPRNKKENLALIHDPGLTPGGIEDAQNFTRRYWNLRNPTLIVTSPLRRCLQTTIHAFGDQIKAGKLRAIANPDLQEVSTAPCDTGTPLDVLREEFSLIEFPDEVFPDIWPRDRNIMPKKRGTIYDDYPWILASRELRVREWLRTLDDWEIVIVTHGSFAHFLFNVWDDRPGDSDSHGFQLKPGQAVPLALPEKSLPMTNFEIFGSIIHIGPNDFYDSSKDNDFKVYLHGKRDCGIFTPDNLR